MSRAEGLPGSISGTVTDAASGEPLPGVTVAIWNITGVHVTQATSGDDGRFTAAGIEPGTYFATTVNGLGYINQAYGQVPCWNCVPTSGVPIDVAADTATTGIDFQMTRGGRVGGRVRDASTAEPLAFVQVVLFDMAGVPLVYGHTNIDGEYLTEGAVPTGTYAVRTMDAAGHIDKLYPNTSCAWGCSSPGMMANVTVTAPDTTTGIDFDLDVSATITGRVIDEATQLPIEAVRVDAMDTMGTVLAIGWTDANGDYAIDSNLMTGDVLVRTRQSGHLDELYNNVSCGADCSWQYWRAARVSVTTGATAEHIDFALALGAAVRGSVLSDGSPVEGAYVCVGSGFMSVSCATADAAGRYAIAGLTPGTYRLRTSTRDHIDEAYPDVPCPQGCSEFDGVPITLAGGEDRAGLDFDLVAGGIITGTITAPGAAPWMTVSARGSTGLQFGAGVMMTPDAPAGFTLRKLPPDTYKIWVDSAGDYIGEVYDNIQCPSSGCWGLAGSSGTPIVIGPGSVVTGIDFTLSTGGTISGTVTDAATSQPLAGVTVTVAMARSAITDAQGHYTVTGLASGQYRLGTSNNAGYIDEEYDNVPCPGPCTFTNGIAVSVTSGAATTGIDFALARGATLSGTIRSNGLPLANVSVNLQTADPTGGGAWTTTDAFGNYTLQKINAGTYYLRASSIDYIDEAYPNVQCLPWCSSTDGTPILIATGENRTGFDFDLARGGVLQGTVTSAGQPITQILSVTALNTTLGKTFYSTMDPLMDPNGYSIRKLPTGTYKVFVSSGNGYIGELYDNVACPSGSCQTDAATRGTPVPLGEGEIRTGINFDLATGGTLSGRVTGNGLPLANVNVLLQQLNGGYFTSAMTGADGRYTLRGVVPGSYSLRTSGTVGYLDELWMNVPCSPGCSLNIGTPVNVIGSGDLTGYDFDLAAAAIVRGTVTGPVPTLAPTSIVLYAAPSTYYYASVDMTGTYRFNAVAPGSYIAYTSNSQGYVDEVYDNVQCTSSCSNTPGATLVMLTAGETRTVDFSLALGAKITGTVRGDGSALPGVIVMVTGTRSANATTDALGRFEIKGLPDGTYRAYTNGNSDFIGQVYNHRACQPSYCDANSGDPITIAGGTTIGGIDFDLVRGSSVTGLVTNSSGVPIQGVNVTVFDRDGFSMRSATTGSSGTYTINGFTPGTVYLRASSPSYVEQLYSGIDCNGANACRAISGTPLEVAPGQQAQANFVLTAAARIVGTVRSASTLGGIPQVWVTAHRADGTPAASAPTVMTGEYVLTGLPAGTYYLRTSGSHGFINQLYPGITCPFSCSVKTGTPITVATGEVAVGKNFDLQPGLRITGRITDEATGLPISASVSVLTASGYYAPSSSSAPDGTYQTAGLPPGKYYLRAQSTQGHIPESFGGLVCLGSCMPSGDAVTVTAADVGNVNFALAKGGIIAGVVTDALTHLPVSSAYVTIVDAAGMNVATATTSASGAFKATTGLPSGTYYMRAGVYGGAYVTRWYGGAECVGSCTNFAGAAPIAVAAPVEAPPVSIELRRGGAIAGRLFDAAGQLLPAGSVQVYTSSGTSAATVVVTGAGTYQTTSSLPAGDYYVVAGAPGMTRRVFGASAECLYDCPLATGTLVHVSADAVTGGIDFTLTPGATVQGRIVDATTHSPVPYVQVFLLDGAGKIITKANGNVDGRFDMYVGLPAGTYYLRTTASGYVPTLQNGAACLANCQPASVAAPIVVSGPASFDFEIPIPLGGRIAGTITSADGAPILGGVEVLDASGAVVMTAKGTLLGEFQTSEGLPAGDYQVRSYNSAGFLDELYDNVPCAGPCTTGGTPVTVTPAAISTGVDFVLDPDLDGDDDGIFDSVDLDGTAISSGFSDAGLGGTTTGTIAERGGWAVVVRDVSPSGVQASIAGSGTGPATFDLCDPSGTERLSLDAAGERANIKCGATGTATVIAVRALPFVELRKPATGAGTVVQIGTGQTASLGSPVVADAANTQPIVITYVDDDGQPLATAVLDPGESVDATVSPAGRIDVTVVSGAVEFTPAGGELKIVPQDGHEVLIFVPADTDGPSIHSISLTPGVLTVPNHRLVSVTVGVEATDNSGVPPVCTIENVSSNEPDNGLGDGDTAIDIVRGTGMTLQLRAERSGTGSGRVYTIGIACRDAIGNVSRANAAVTVPKGR